MSDLQGYGLGGITRQRGLPVSLPQTATVSSVTGETVQLQYISSGALTNDAGQAAGVAVQGRFAGRHILDSAGSTLATKRNTSLSFTAGALTAEVYKDPGFFESLDGLSPEAALNAATSGLSNGQYVVDYERGIIYGVKTTTASTLASVAYMVISQPSTGGGDVNITEIGGTAVSVDEGDADAGTMRVVAASAPKTFTDSTATATTSSATILASNASRKMGTSIINTSTSVGVFLNVTDAAVVNQGIFLAPYGVLVMDETWFTRGAITGITASGSAVLSIMEAT